VDELMKAYDEGKLDEAFGSGTAAVISPVGQITYKDKDMIINDGKMGEITSFLYDRITGIQNGRYPDPFNWVIKCN
ncbi:MAG: branched chain amino acid aminotransferase, partial [Christensenellales bacterium]